MRYRPDLQELPDNEDIPPCPDCEGTGIGLHGDPNHSRCLTCGGRGVIRRQSEDDYQDRYAMDRDARLIEELDREERGQ